MREKLRDKTRDDLAHALNSLGVRAEMAVRGRVEEKVNNSWYKRSLGVIDLPEGPIKWINILKKDGGKDSPPRWWINLCIPDERPVIFHKEVKVRAVRKKSFPLFGKVVDVTWKGEDYGTGLVYTLNNDESSKALATAVGNLEVRSYSKEFQGWTLQVDRRFNPTSRDWEALPTTCYLPHEPCSHNTVSTRRSGTLWKTRVRDAFLQLGQPLHRRPRPYRTSSN